ncbi:MAG: hypothetical protein LBO69_01975 [Ignavibacteria bacterium]|jgi:hypothetical protein|nr:hypothetical protein [Ignavibacteria bacterium]
MKLTKYLITIFLFFTLLFSANATPFYTKDLQMFQVNSASQPLPFFAYQKTDGTKIAPDNVKKNDTRSTPTNTEPKQSNSIKKIWEGTDGLLNVEADIADDKDEVKIVVYNMLGKEVRKVFQGIPAEKNAEGHYLFNSQTNINLPKNVYILVIQGTTFKIADRFVIAR